VSKSGSGSWSLASTGLSWVNDENAASSSYDDNLTTSPKKVYSTTASTWHSISSNGSSYAGFIGVAADNRTLPAIAAVADICAGGTVNLAAPTASWGTPLERSWTIYQGTTTAGTVVFTSTVADPVATGALTTVGAYLVKYQERDACCGWSIPVFQTFNVVADPALSAPTALTTICVGGSVNLTSNLSGGTGTQTPVWEYSSNGTSGWATVANGTPAGSTYTNQTTATLTVAGITAVASHYYRRSLASHRCRLQCCEHEWTDHRCGRPCIKRTDRFDHHLCGWFGEPYVQLIWRNRNADSGLGILFERNQRLGDSGQWYSRRVHIH
jgi:hypothetical protein